MRNQSGHSAAAILTARWETLLRCRKACLRHDDLDTVHDLRVATRRARAALQLFRPYAPAELKAVYGDLRALTREIGQLRNLDEALLFFERAFGSPEGHSFARVSQSLQMQRDFEAGRVRTLLRQFDAEGASRSLKQAALRLPGDSCRNGGRVPSLPAHLSQTGILLFADIRRLVPIAVRPEAVENRHALRIAVKRWRYFIEILAEWTGLDYGDILSILKEYQGLLGHLNDLAVFSALVHRSALTDQERTLFCRRANEIRSGYFQEFLDLLHRRPLRYVFRF